MWKMPDQHGSFDEGGYDIGHIIEHAVSKDDDVKNLQALCKTCHSVKTRRFMQEIRKKNNDQINKIDTIREYMNKKKSNKSKSEINPKKGLSLEETNRRAYEKMKKYYENDPGETPENIMEDAMEMLMITRLKYPELYYANTRYTKNY